ncbi:DUF1284 domain-containing protein [Rhizobium sp. C4]|uniref:DUF1284 domain-containing protein n=1 Tax=Rhizobium sp. C4 TaxID=1349800 RepID=UPI001E49975E|nr:DUF1284 domain-containing protein [Rhizobium sp. C4]MCD2172962.1 DUF1284 domain-containing protein [Rhizobium sp. C4]
MTIRLRGHHFLCLLTYKGLGYTPAFVENMTAVAMRINAGAKVILHAGPDDICGALTPADRAACNHDCAKPETAALDEMAEKATAAVLGHGLDEAFALDAEKVAQLRAAFLTGESRAACGLCRWRAVCDEIAQSGYAHTLLKGAHAA